jgi:hypothetical protein
MEGLTGTRAVIIADQITDTMIVTDTTKTAMAARMRMIDAPSEARTSESERQWAPAPHGPVLLERVVPGSAFDAARGSQVSPELSDFVLAFRLPVVSPAGFPRLGRKRGHKPAYKGRTPAAAI